MIKNVDKDLVVINDEIQECMQSIRELSIILDIKKNKLFQLLEERQNIHSEAKQPSEQ